MLIYANTPHELYQMLQELADGSENMGKKINKPKTKVMVENDRQTNGSSMLRLSPNHGTLRLHSDDDDDNDDDNEQSLHKDPCLICQICRL